MRNQTPESITRTDCSVVNFKPFETGFMAGTFEFVTQNFGNDESFSWISDEGEKRFTVSLVGEGFAVDDSSKITLWDITILDDNNAVQHYLRLGEVKDDGLVHPTLIDHGTKRKATPFQYSEVMNTVLDLKDELSQSPYDSVIIFKDGEPYAGRGMRGGGTNA